MALVHADVVQEQRVTVGRGLGDAGRTDRPTRTTDILDDDLLAELAAHRLGHEPGDRVGRAAGRERHDHRDGALGIGLGSGDLRQQCQRGDGKRRKQFLHVFLPEIVLERLARGDPRPALGRSRKRRRRLFNTGGRTPDGSWRIKSSRWVDFVTSAPEDVWGPTHRAHSAASRRPRR